MTRVTAGPRTEIANQVIKFAGSTNLGLVVLAAMSGPSLGQVAPPAIGAVGAITVAALGVAGAALRGSPRTARR